MTAPKPRGPRAPLELPPLTTELGTWLFVSPLGVPFVRIERAKSGGKRVFVSFPLRLLDDAIAQILELRGEAVARFGPGCTRAHMAGRHGTFADPYPRRAAESGEAPTPTDAAPCGEELPE